MSNSSGVSDANAEFWNELCGSQLARVLGIKDSTPESLKRFDDWYFDFYPYLDKYIQFDSLAGKDVLEVGLGYGSVAQKIAGHGARYRGLDIASGPVGMVQHRLTQAGLKGQITQGSILNPPFEIETFDVVVAIGCLHHTGDLRSAINQCLRLLRKGGRLVFMVYYAYSYRRWVSSPFGNLRYLFREMNGLRDVVGASHRTQRGAYDKNSKGEAAPHTDWISKKSLADLCAVFSSFSPALENIDTEPPFWLWSRQQLLSTKIPGILGLDLYAVATK